MSRRGARRRLTLLATATCPCSRSHRHRRIAHRRIGASRIGRHPTVGLGGWQVQSTAQATQSRATDLDAGLPDRLMAARSRPTTPAPSGPRSARSSRPATALTCSSRTTSRPASATWTRSEPTRSRSSRSRGGSAPTSSPGGWGPIFALHRPDRQRGRRSGRRVGQRPGGRDAGRPCRATTPGTRSTSPVCFGEALNTLALEVYPNNPNTMFTLDNVDWTQIPPDNNTGIQFPIQLHTSGPLALSERARRPGRRPGPLERRADA